MVEYDPYSPRRAASEGVSGKSRSRKAKVAERLATPDNSPEAGQQEGAASNVARDQLRNFVERIERLNEEKAELADDIKAVFAEAKAGGFDAKVLRRVIAIRKQDQNERLEFEAILDTYLHALGMVPDPEGLE